MRTWFLADAHFDDVPLIKESARPFRDIDEWNETLIDNINRCVIRSDRLVLVGDFGHKRIPYWRSRIRCRHITYVLGNHDKSSKIKRAFGGEVYQYRVMKFFDTKLVVCHFPMMYWEGSHVNWMHVYGHVHNQREAYLDWVWPQRRSMDVCPESAAVLYGEWRPHSDEEIYDRLKDRKGHDALGFYHRFQDRLVEERKE